MVSSSYAKRMAAAVLLALFADGGTPVAAQQSGTVQGTVVEAAAARPVANVEVQIQGTPLSTLTNVSGRFELVGVPAGTHVLRVETLGFATLTREIAVSAGEATTVELELEHAAVELDELVVTALGVERPRRAVPSPWLRSAPKT